MTHGVGSSASDLFKMGASLADLLPSPILMSLEYAATISVNLYMSCLPLCNGAYPSPLWNGTYLSPLFTTLPWPSLFC
jgi:hypothetical protein